LKEGQPTKRKKLGQSTRSEKKRKPGEKEQFERQKGQDRQHGKKKRDGIKLREGEQPLG
jgi:hypothetical protein